MKLTVELRIIKFPEVYPGEQRIPGKWRKNLVKRNLLIFGILATVSFLGFAGRSDRVLVERWEGAWVITGIEAYSDCGEPYTGNRVTGNLVKGKGRHRFSPGELARVDAVLVKGAKVELRLSVGEAVLVEDREGPFTLHREATCRVGLELEIPKSIRKQRMVEGMEEILGRILERYPSERAARDSASWNRRRREAYPVDYERILAQHAVWKVETLNARVKKRFEGVLEETYRMTERMNPDPDYQAGFFAGVRSARSESFGSCADLMTLDLESTTKKAGKRYEKKGKIKSPSAREGFEDGHLLVYGLKLMRRLPDCSPTVAESYSRTRK